MTAGPSAGSSGSAAPFSRPKTLIVSTLLGAAVVSGAWMLQRGSRSEGGSVTSGVALFDQVRTLVQQRYLDSVPDSLMYRYAVEGMVGELGDPYSVFLPPTRLTKLRERTTGNYAGVGLQVDMRDGMLVVVNPLSGGPGERAGILTGDRIVEIDSVPVHGLTPEEVQRLLRGAPGSAVHLTIEHPGAPSTVQISLARAEIHQSAVGHAAELPNHVGYVTLRIFSDSSALELQRAIDSLLSNGATSLIFDLRGNPGGLLEQGVKVADLFLDKGMRVVSTRGRDKTSEQVYVDSQPQRWPRLPVVVLVDDRSASAAELVAGALQDNDRAAVIGTTTFGKGSAQTVFPLDDDGALKLTTARWFTPLGRSISKIEPIESDALPPSDKKAPRPRYLTASGRTVFGGGGIVPDLTVGDSMIAPENLALMQALGRKVGNFRDALTSYALAVKASHAVKNPEFTVTPAMLDDVYKRMQARGVDVPRNIYDDASPLIARLLIYEVNRYVFGADAEFYRKAMDDKAITAASRVLSGAKAPRDVLTRATNVSSARVNSEPATNG